MPAAPQVEQPDIHGDRDRKRELTSFWYAQKTGNQVLIHSYQTKPLMLLDERNV